jgi:hypothetical protein
MRSLASAVLPLLLFPALTHAQAKYTPAHARPYLMPAAERTRLHKLIRAHDWARAEHDRLKTAAGKGDGHAAAFLYALDGDAKYLPAARKWLLSRWGKDSYWVKRARERLADGKFFKGGQPGIPEVYYDTNLAALVGYDWVARGLSAAERKEIEKGIVTWARYKMRCMHRWTQTPNLVFKPTCTVALSGLVTGDKECLKWGFERTRPHGGALGGYDVVLQTMLLDGGPWREAPIYPIAHEVLPLVCRLSGYRRLLTGKDWFRRKLPGGCSPAGLMDYYIDTAYPIEVTGHGKGQVRVATYGDGATNAQGDLFLVNPAGAGLNAQDALVAAHDVSGDARYAAFVALIPDYRPGLIERRPLPARVALPPAPSKVWPNYGLAMLRSNESPAYWTSGKAIAVFQLMSQGYGHDHRDKFSITLHGGGRLFYPDYNAIQYENPAVGWTRNTVCHNTLVVDEGDTRDARPAGVRHAFTPEVKFLATSASGVYEGVDQTRALFLTSTYLLDLFHAASKVPHTYDYLLHSFGRVRPAGALPFKPSAALARRYGLVDKQQALSTDKPWAVDFEIAEKPGSRKGKYGKEWYAHRARLRLSVAGEPGTTVVHGVWGDELAKLVSARQPGAVMDRLSMVAARRAGRRDTVFVAVHEPTANADRPGVRAVTTLARGRDAILVRVDGGDFIDYVAVAFGPQKGRPEHVLGSTVEKGVRVAFKDYGYLRVGRAGAVGRGGWTFLQLPGERRKLTLEGKPAAVTAGKGVWRYGAEPVAKMVKHVDEPECPLEASARPAVVRLFGRDRKAVTLVLRNPLKEAVSGWLELDLPEGLAVEPARPVFGPLKPGAKGEVRLTFVASNPKAGKHTVAYRVVQRVGKGKEQRTGARALAVAVGPTLEWVYQYPKTPVYRVQAPRLTAELDMRHGLCRYLADDGDVVRLRDAPLFTLSDGKSVLLSEKTTHAFTWPHEVPAHLTAQAHDRCRWQALFFADRMLVRMDPGWTQFPRAHFVVPGKWVSPRGAPKWRRVVALDKGGKEYEAKPGAKVKVAAAELAFPDGGSSLAFRFEPAQEVSFKGAGLSFSLGSLTRDNWQVGFCKPGGLDAWRGKK